MSNKLQRVLAPTKRNPTQFGRLAADRAPTSRSVPRHMMRGRGLRLYEWVETVCLCSVVRGHDKIRLVCLGPYMFSLTHTLTRSLESSVN